MHKAHQEGLDREAKLEEILTELKNYVLENLPKDSDGKQALAALFLNNPGEVIKKDRVKIATRKEKDSDLGNNLKTVRGIFSEGVIRIFLRHCPSAEEADLRNTIRGIHVIENVRGSGWVFNPEKVFYLLLGDNSE
jgi:uncharacterized protein with PhoU and TrkA domain